MAARELSTNEMARELKSRKIKLESPETSLKPRKFYNAREIVGHFNDVIEVAENMIDDIAAGVYHRDHDNVTLIYKAFMEQLYGDTVWKWMSETIEKHEVAAKIK